MKTPQSVRLPRRSSVTGEVPTNIEEGSLHLNQTDLKLYVGQPDNSATRIVQWLRDHNPALSYKIGDFAIYLFDMWRCVVDAPPGPFDPTRWERLTDAARSTASEPFASSVVRGGEVTLAGAAQVQVAEGDGIVVDTTDPAEPLLYPITWSGFTFAIPTDDPIVIVALDQNGIGQAFRSADWTVELRRQHVQLSQVVIDTVNNQALGIIRGPVVGAQTAEAFVDLYDALGQAFITAGVDLRSAGLMTIRHTLGATFTLGHAWHTTPQNPNILSIAAQNPITFDIVDRSFQKIGTTGSNIDPTQWDNNGTIEAVPAGQATIQYVFATPDAAGYWVQLGQALYSSVGVAQSQIGEDWTNYAAAPQTGPLVPLGAVVVRQNATDLEQPAQGAVVTAIKGISGPFIQQAQFDDSALYRLDGSRPLAGDMQGGNFTLQDVTIDEGTF